MKTPHALRIKCLTFLHDGQYEVCYISLMKCRRGQVSMTRREVFTFFTFTIKDRIVPYIT
jgi:hypothetical protein